MMVDDGETYYGTVRGMVDSSWKIINGEVRNVITTEDICNIVLKKFPTLEGREWNVAFNN